MAKSQETWNKKEAEKKKAKTKKTRNKKNKNVKLIRKVEIAWMI